MRSNCQKPVLLLGCRACVFRITDATVGTVNQAGTGGNVTTVSGCKSTPASPKLLQNVWMCLN